VTPQEEALYSLVLENKIGDAGRAKPSFAYSKEAMNS
jgi:hypothetical protein